MLGITWPVQDNLLGLAKATSPRESMKHVTSEAERVELLFRLDMDLHTCYFMTSLRLCMVCMSSLGKWNVFIGDEVEKRVLFRSK